MQNNRILSLFQPTNRFSFGAVFLRIRIFHSIFFIITPALPWMDILPETGNRPEINPGISTPYDYRKARANTDRTHSESGAENMSEMKTEETSPGMDAKISSIHFLTSAGYFRFISLDETPEDPYRPAPEKNSLADRNIAPGFWIDNCRDVKEDIFFYNISGGLFLNAVHADQISENGGSNNYGENRNRQMEIFLPGDNLNAGLRFSKNLKFSLSLGRTDFTDITLQGDSDYTHFKRRINPSGNASAVNLHGPSTGVFLILDGENYGTVYLTAFHEPLLSGSYLSESSEKYPASSDILYGKKRFYRDMDDVRNNSGSRGHSFLYRFNYSLFFFSFLYNINIQDETASGKYTPPRTEDRIESIAFTLGTAVEKKNFEGNLILSLERSYGFYRTQEHSQNGQYTGEVDGLLLRLSLNARLKIFYITGNFIFPEPATRSPGPLSGIKDSSGYVGYGNTMIRSPLLRGSLDYTPFPVFCNDREECSGLSIRHSEISTRDHSAAGFLEISAKIRSSIFSISAEQTAPVRERSDKRKNPFRTLSVDSERPSYSEYSIRLTPYDFKSFNYHFEYSRLYRKNSSGEKFEFSGESYGISLTVLLN